MSRSILHEPHRTLLRQLETAWKLTQYHLNGLTTEECLWRPASTGLHVHPLPNGLWRADWPEHEGYDLGPPSIAWVTWHIGFWWGMVLDHTFGNGSLQRETIPWPGNADAVRENLNRLHNEWLTALEPLTEDDLRSAYHTRWPFQGRPFGDVVAWVNLELTKNATEIGYARFLYAVRAGE
ncbi:MAG: DinB family protein [Anaerolineales bacterium]